MAYNLNNKSAKNFCEQIVLVQLIVENMVTCFIWNTVHSIYEQTLLTVRTLHVQ